MTQGSSPRRILCFGEMLLRFSPNQNELLMQSPALTIRPAGAEANVAVSLACFGAPTAMATVLPDNALGRGSRDEVRKHGVDTTPVVFKPGRMGLYFLTPGAVRRPSEVLYDRAGSAFVEHVNSAFDWDALLDGVEWLHASGVTPATGPNGTAAAVAIIAAAVRKGVKVSYDGNFRGKLWEQWDGDPPTTLGRMLSGATIAFADDRDFALVLKTKFDSADPAVRRREAAKRAVGVLADEEQQPVVVDDGDDIADHGLPPSRQRDAPGQEGADAHDDERTGEIGDRGDDVDLEDPEAQVLHLAHRVGELGHADGRDRGVLGRK